MIGEFIPRLLDGHDLTREDAREIMDEIMAGRATPGQIGGFLVALRAKGETADEIAGFAESMRSHVVPVRPNRTDVIDTAGTGGDGAGTLNLSTAAALVAAAAGAAVAKHGNRAVSSDSGSADVLAALGFNIELAPGRIADSIDALGFGFLFAPAHHPAMRHAMPVRRELGTRTVFNILGPLTNPAGASGQVVGVFAKELAPTIANVLSLLGTRHSLVVHGAGGIDELSPAGENLVYEVTNGTIDELRLDPSSLGIPRCGQEALKGGTPEENAAAIRAVFGGEEGPIRDAVLLNAAAAIRVSGGAESFEESLVRATDAIDSGNASRRLDALVAFSQESETG